MVYRKTKFIILVLFILFIVFTTTSSFIVSANNEVEFRNREENKSGTSTYNIYALEEDSNSYQNNSFAYVYQKGNDNYTYISQKKSINYIDTNMAIVFQEGNENYSFVEQEGKGSLYRTIRY